MNDNDSRIVRDELLRPCLMFKPTLSKDGNSWCFLLGENLQTGVAGFGKTADEASYAFDKAFYNEG